MDKEFLFNQIEPMYVLNIFPIGLQAEGHELPV